MAPRVSTVWMPAPLLRWAPSVHACHALLHGMADWDAVRLSLELARAKTLARAARRLRVDYTTVGRRISAFEHPSEQHAVAARSRSERARRGSAHLLPGRCGSAAAPRLPRSARLLPRNARSDCGGGRKLAQRCRPAGNIHTRTRPDEQIDPASSRDGLEN